MTSYVSALIGRRRLLAGASLAAAALSSPRSVLAYHFAWLGIGHVAKAGEGFRHFLAPMQVETVAGI